MATQTPNYSFEQPAPGGDDNLWGDYLNANWGSIDTLLKAIEDRMDAVEVAAQIAVGDLYFSVDATDPSSKLGYGTWVAYAAGRAIVGVGDSGAGGSAWAAGEVKGTDTHALSAAELPSHQHTVNPPSTALSINGVGNHSHNIQGQIAFGNGSVTNSFPGTIVGDGFRQGNTTDGGGAHSHTGSVNIAQFNSGAVGSSAAHTSLQPSIAVYIWRRTA